MPERPSERKRIANRQNARKSTGPKTPAGKRRVARNALRHGLLAKELVIEGGRAPESAAEFASLVNDVTAAMGPRDGIERALVGRIAACLWRLQRAQRFEVGAIRSAAEQAEAEGPRAGPMTQRIGAELEHLQAASAFARRQIGLLRHPLEKLGRTERLEVEQWLRRAGAQCDPPRADVTDPAVLEKALTIAQADLEHAERGVEECMSRRAEAMAADAESESRRAWQACLPSERKLFRLIRYESMLDRQLHRALSEFRRRRERMAEGGIGRQVLGNAMRAAGAEGDPAGDGSPPL